MKRAKNAARRQKYRSGPLEDQYREYICLWMLRILVRLKGYRVFKKPFSVDKAMLVDFLKPDGYLLERDEDDGGPLLPIELLSDMLDYFEPNFCAEKTALGVGIDLLVDALEMTATERDILQFVIIMKSCYPMDEALDLVAENHDLSSMCTALSVILKRPRNAIEDALSPQSPLINSGLIRIHDKAAPLKRKLELVDGLVDKLATAHSKTLDVLSLFVNRAPSAILSQDDFAECSDYYALVSEYLAAAIENKLSGVNILIYGAPGVGKTQMARSICESLGVSLFEVPDQKEQGDAYTPAERFGTYQLSQRILERKTKCAVLFDEMEDVFPRPGPIPFMNYARSRSQDSKAWLNRLLESNQTPTLWIGNEVSHLDPAYLRRFDLVIELPRPSRSMRKRILTKCLSKRNIQAEDWIETVPDSPLLTPGLIEKAVRVIRAVDADSERAVKLYGQLTGSVLKAMGHDAPASPRTGSVIAYDLDMINADVDPGTLVRGIAATGEGRILLYGAPGTGKTELAHYLAGALEKPLVVRKPSDLLGKYVGSTEKNLAMAFEEASAEGAVLLLDEIDSFLRTRLVESRSWEISQVNELLVQIESFKGVLVACTNAFNVLDEAALRRFDVKVKFDYLAADQVRKLFFQVIGCDESGGSAANELINQRLVRLESLTPGDFHAIVRKLKITGVPIDAQSLCSALEQECARKTEYKGRGIGFSANL